MRTIMHERRQHSHARRLLLTIIGLLALAAPAVFVSMPAYAASGWVSVGAAAVDRSATDGSLIFAVSATAGAYWDGGPSAGTSCYGSGTCYLKLEVRPLSGPATEVASVTAAPSSTTFSHMFASYTAITEIDAVRLVLQGNVGTVVGAWIPVTDPYPTPVVSVSGTVDRSTTNGNLTWNLTASASNYALLDSACPSGSNAPCYLVLEGKLVSDGTAEWLDFRQDLNGSTYPYTATLSGSGSVGEISHVRVRIYRPSLPISTQLTGAWVSVNDPFPSPDVSLNVVSTGRDATSGFFTYSTEITTSNFMRADAVCRVTNQSCNIWLQARLADDSIIDFDLKPGIQPPYPYVTTISGALNMLEVVEIRAMVSSSSGSTPGPMYSAWHPIDDTLPEEVATLKIRNLSRDGATGKLTWKVDATAANFQIEQAVCHEGNLSCSMRLEALLADGSTTVLDMAVGLQRPYPDVRVLSGNMTVDIPVVALRLNLFNSSRDFDGPWYKVRDPLLETSRGGMNPSMKGCVCAQADPISTATGEFYLPVSDLVLPGVGPMVGAERTYSAFGASEPGPFGYGWAAGFDVRLNVVRSGTPAHALPYQVEVVQESGATTPFFESDGLFPSDPWVLATLTHDEVSGRWTFTRQNREVFVFDSDGRLIESKDLHGNVVEFDYDSSDQLTSIAGSGGRSVDLVWSSGRVTSVTDSANRTVSYAYTSGDLTSVTGADGTTWSYAYDSEHRMLALTSPEGGTTTNVYDAFDRVLTQTDQIGRVTSFSYSAFATTTTLPDGSVTIEEYSQGSVVKITQAAGTAAESVTTMLYDEAGNLAAVTDPLGNTTTSTFDSAGNPITTTDPLGRTTTREFDSLRNVTSIEDPLGRTTEMTYSSGGDLLTLTSPDENEQSWTYNADGTPATHTDARNKVSTYSYDAAGRLECSTDPDSRATCVDYDDRGFATTTTDGAGEDTVYTYDHSGRVLTVTDPINAVTTTVYDDNGNVLSVEDPTGNITSFTYDDADQVLSSTNPNNGVTAYTYSPRGEVASVTDPTSNTVTSTYDALNRVATVTNGANNTTTYVYDLAGSLLSTTLPSTAVSSTTYDDASQVVSTTDALGKVTEYAYDLAGQLVEVTDPLNRTTTSTYTADGLVDTVTYPDASTEVHAYNATGQETSFVNADGAESTYDYGNAGLLASKAEPGGLETAYTYDDAGRVETVTTPDGHLSTRGYDPAGRLIGINYPGTADDVTFTYDAAGRRLTMDDATGTTIYTYTDGGQTSTLEDGDGATLAYEYNSAGQLVTITYPGNHDVDYTYDSAGRMASVTGWATGTTTYDYSVDGYVAARSDANGVSETRAYDAKGQLTNITAATTSSTLSTYGYGYDDAGQLTSTTMTDALHTAITQNWGYDPIGQLTTTGPTGSYAATPAGLVTTTPAGDSLTYNSAGQLTRQTNNTAGTDTNYTYDANGARIGAVTDYPAGPDLTIGYDYNEGGALTEYTDGTHFVGYSVDGDGLRQSRTQGSTTRELLWDTTASIPLLLDDDEHTYIYGVGITPIVQVDSVGEVEYLYSDNIGSVRTITDDTGTSTGTTDYDPYGARVATTGTSASEIGYTGAWTDDTSGLIYLRARDYDTAAAQFLLVDPLVDQTRQAYAYTSNNPLNAADPTGLCVGMDGTPQDRPCTANDFFWDRASLDRMNSSASEGIGVNLANIAFGIGDGVTANPALTLFGAGSWTELLRNSIGGVECVIPSNGFRTFGSIWGGAAVGGVSAAVPAVSTALYSSAAVGVRSAAFGNGGMAFNSATGAALGGQKVAGFAGALNNKENTIRLGWSVLGRADGPVDVTSASFRLSFLGHHFDIVVGPPLYSD